MTEQQSGLRFDIYERVHLQEGAHGIQELDEVELVPHIQVVSQSEQAVLKGYLRLSGSYTGEGEEENRTLEHQIPVEITLPASRVGNAQDLFVEIENFDIDVLSPRSLNVTGVLSLHGVEMMSAPDAGWRSEEETVFVHRPGAPEDELLSATADRPLYAPEAEASAETPRSEPSSSAAPPPKQQHPFPPNVTPHFVEPAVELAAETTNVQPEGQPLDVDIDVNVEETEIAAGDITGVVESDASPEVVLHAEEKKDVKVAFGSKKVAELAQEATYGVKSLIQKSSSIFQDKRKKAEPAAPASEPTAESVEWKRLFLSSAADGQEFRKLRMAIVQKEETLETIAQRYQINPRELQLLNRLQEGEVAAGQVIYIPR